MSRRPSQGKLFDSVGTSSTTKNGKAGPVYQGVCKQLRELFPAGDEDAQKRKRALAGTIAQARSVAASIDRVSGHDSPYQAAGMQLAALHTQLDELLVRLAPADGKDDWALWLEQLARPELEQPAEGSSS